MRKYESRDGKVSMGCGRKARGRQGLVVVRLGNGPAAKIPSFIALHKLFGEARQRSMMDSLAERIVQLGGTAEGTIQVAAERTEHTRCIFRVSATISTRFRPRWPPAARVRRCAIDQTDELGDKDTADIVPEISLGVDKYLWFVEVHIG